MIPDDTFDFNHHSALRIFDDHEARLRHLLRQDVMPTLNGGHLLSVCQVCKQPWYKASRQEYPRLTPKQLAFLCAALHVDSNALHLLPRALCPICSTIYLGGSSLLRNIHTTEVITSCGKAYRNVASNSWRWSTGVRDLPWIGFY